MMAISIQILSSSVGQLFAGCFLEGFSIGQTTIIGPTYLAEVSPRAIRGMCTCIFAGAIYIGVSISYLATLCKLRKLPTDHPYIVSEISDINESLMSGKQATSQRSKLGMLKELFCSRANLHRFFVIAAGVQL